MDKTSEEIIESVFVAATKRTDGAANYLRNPHEIRRRAGGALARARQGISQYFTVNNSALDLAAEGIAKFARERLPTKAAVGSELAYSGPFQAGGIDRFDEIDRMVGEPGGMHRAQRARAQVDLVFISNLLTCRMDAHWQYHETASGMTFSGDEGISLAVFDAFKSGLFSSDKGRPLQVDAAGMRGVSLEHLAQAFQFSAGNEFDGLTHGVKLVRRVGEILEPQAPIFGPGLRPAGLFDSLTQTEQHEIPPTAQVSAADILTTLLMVLSPIWPAENTLGENRLGDCWPLAAADGPGLSDGWMPFHWMAQRLTYGLIAPFRRAGVRVLNIESLTGLADPDNGQFFVDKGVLLFKHQRLYSNYYPPGDPFIIEWRALTIGLLDELASRLQPMLGMDKQTILGGDILAASLYGTERARPQSFYESILARSIPYADLEA